MSYTVRFMKAGNPLYTFASPTPFVAPKHRYEFDQANPPRLTAIFKTWTIEGLLFAGETSVISQWNALKAAIETGVASYPDGVQLLQTGTVIEDFGSSGGYRFFKVEELSAPKTDMQWRGEIRFTITITGKKVISAGLINAAISKLVQTEDWVYDEAGLATVTLNGELEVTSGSAVSAARTLGSLGLTLPDSTYGWVTNGPQQVDVTQLDTADTKAHFISIMKQAGSALPSGVGPSYSRTLRVTRTEGLITSTVTAEAVGPNAEAAVRAEKPSGALTEDVETNAFRLSARATYTTKKTDGRLVRTHVFTTSGGGKGIAFTKLTGGRHPAKHVLPYGPVEIVETISLEIVGVPAMDDFLLPPPAAGLDEDTDQIRCTLPHRTKIGRERAGDEWRMEMRRVYRMSEGANVPASLSDTIFRPNPNSRPQDEFARANGGGNPVGRSAQSRGGFQGLGGTAGLFGIF